jgi:hypothetical protein
MRYERTIGAFALPGQNPGCITIVGSEGVNKDLHVIDEFESHITNDLIRYLYVFEDKWRPEWFGDSQNRTARHLLNELNQERGGPNDHCMRRREIYPRWSAVLDEVEPYQHLCAILQPLLQQDMKRLHLHDSKAGLYFSELKPEEFHCMTWGENPTVEALGMAVFELLTWERREYEWELDRPEREARQRECDNYSWNGR